MKLRNKLTDNDQSEANSGRNPVGMLRTRRPGVYEETHRYKRGAKDTGNQVVFDLSESAGGQPREDAVFEVEKLDCKGEKAGGDDSEENQTCGSTAETKVDRVDEGERLYIAPSIAAYYLEEKRVIGGRELTSKKE